MRPFVPAFFADLFCNRLFVFLLQLHLQRGITVRTAVTDLAVQRYIQLASRNALVVGDVYKRQPSASLRLILRFWQNTQPSEQ